MARFVIPLIFLIVLAVFTHETFAQKYRPPPRCRRPYQVYVTCGTRCPPTCENLKPACNKACYRGCQCRSGYVKGPGGDCIRPDDCPNITTTTPSPPTPPQYGGY